MRFYLSHLHKSAQQCKALTFNKFLQMCRFFHENNGREVNDIKNRGGIMKKRIETESLLSLFQNQWLVIYQTSTTLLSKELGKRLYAIDMVDGAASFATAVHSKDAIAHVYTAQRY